MLPPTVPRRRSLAHYSPFAPPSAPSVRVFGSQAPDAISLGRHVDAHGVGAKIQYAGDQGVIILGPNGKGKGTRVLMPNLLQMDGASVVVVDPKGELAAITASYRRTLGPVVILNPFGVLTDIPGYADLRSDGFNPFATLDPAAPSFNSQASLLADALVSVSRDDGGNAKYFSGSGRALFAALIMQATIEARAAGQVPTMAQIRQMLCQPSSGGDPAADMPPIGLPELAEQMGKSGIVGLRNKAAQFSEWNKETGAIARTAMIETEPFDDPEIAYDLAHGTFDFRDLKRRPTTVYLILPPHMMARHSKWLRLVLTAALHAVMRARAPNEPKCVFMLDEFFALGHLEIISTVWALVRGYGVQLMPVLQDLPQLKALYPKNWETFIGMAGAVLSFAPNEAATADWLSKRAGETTRTLTTSNTSTTLSEGNSGGSSTGGNGGNGSSNEGWNKGKSTSTTSNTSPVKVPLIEPHRIYGLKPGFALTFFDGLSNVVPSYVPGYYQIKTCISRAPRPNPYYLG